MSSPTPSAVVSAPASKRPPPAAKVGKAPAPPQFPREGPRIDLLTRFPRLKWLVQRRWFQFAVVLPNLLLFLLFLVAGIFGTPVGNRNIIIVFVWILWWFLLISALVPFASRIWCTACPFPFFGEWAQRRALIDVRAVDSKERKGGPGKVLGRNRYFGSNLKWPKALSNIWMQNIGFLTLCTFSALFLTRPIVSVIVLGSLFLIATVLHLVYRQRTFCSYVCPVSGFLSLFSMASVLEVRSRDLDVCDKCTDKGCLAGSEKGWGCPWLLYPSKLDRNNYCGLCMECMKSCPHDNMTINLRPFCSDNRLKGYDEAWKAFIMLSLAITYSVIYLGPWAKLKDWANIAEKKDWAGFFIYVAVLWVGALVVVPGIYYVAVRAGGWLSGAATAKPSLTTKDLFLAFAYSLVPLGLMAWVAFSFPLILVNGSYILMVLSDPLGWGWDLFHTAHVAWTPVVPQWTPYLQVGLLVFGLFYALRIGYRHARRLLDDPVRAAKAFAPVSIVLTAIVLGFFSLYIG